MFYFIFALIIGSFLNVLIYRIPRGESIVFPPSHCPQCGHRLGVGDLIPVLSYIFLRGRCRYCHHRINPRYAVVEVLTALLTLGWAAKFQPDLSGVIHLLFLYLLLVIGFIDLEHRIIPDALVLPTAALFLFYRLHQGQLLDAFLGSLLPGGILFAIAFFYPQGMGMGDAKLMAMAGALLGWEKTTAAIFIGSCGGTVLLLPLLCLKKINRKTPVPFGPFLASALILVVLESKVTAFLFRWWEHTLLRF
ncbi:MAG TPA: prepilin peptidase [Bacillota bacterium]